MTVLSFRRKCWTRFSSLSLLVLNPDTGVNPILLIFYMVIGSLEPIPDDLDGVSAHEWVQLHAIKDTTHTKYGDASETTTHVFGLEFLEASWNIGRTSSTILQGKAGLETLNPDALTTKLPCPW